MSSHVCRVLCGIALVLLSPVISRGQAQEEERAVPRSGRVVSPAGRPVPSGRPDQKPGNEKAAEGGKKPADGQKDAADGEEKKDDGEPKVITRSSQPQLSEEFFTIDIEPDADGKVTFNFQGIPWLPVLTWLAKVSDRSLDWQELPGDYLNLRTQRAYDLDEARDLINRHLLARGFTLLVDGELLTVVNISKINPAMVPRVEPDKLADRMPHDFAKVSFPLKWMLAEKAAEELKPMLSRNGTIAPLKSVNRLEVMDAVINLQEIHHLLSQEQSSSRSEPTLIRVFPLEHVRAAETVSLLEEILGLEKPAGGGELSSGIGHQIMQQLQRMQRSPQPGGKGGSGDDEENKPRLVVNERQNSILAHAPPDKMEIIEQTIQALDVPQERDRHILQHIDRMKVYRLTTLDPEPLVQVLLDLGDLSPRSKIQVDEDNRSIIVFGTLADHVTVKTLVERLDGSARSFEVIPLRRLRADEVAGTIQYMMGEEEEEDDNSRRGYYSYYSYRYGSGRDSSSNREARPFRVDADVENNRLLLWANEVEYKEVCNLLEKMGEIPPDRGSSETMRVIDLPSDAEAEQILERLRTIWPNIRPNELRLQPLRRKSQPKPPASDVEPGPRTDVPRGRESQPPVVGRGDGPAMQLAVMQQEHPLRETENDLASAPAGSGSDDVPPIIIQQLPDGRIILGSQDTRALDRLEEVLGQLTPATPEFHVFKLKHPNTWAYGIELILEEFFQNREDEETVFDPYWGYSYSQKDDSPNRLSRKKQLKIISDSDSRTILVQGATAEQLKIIENLIDIYDQPVSNDPASVRRMQVFRLQYSDAKTIADTVKSVYRDLLSANDPALQSGNQNREPSTVEKGITYVYNRGPQTGGDEPEPQTPIRFKGLLSVGVDDVSNSVVVSAAEGLMGDIEQLIKSLDEAARPQTKVQVLQLSPGLNVSTLKDRLNEAFGEKRTRTGNRSDRGSQPGQNNLPQQSPQSNGSPQGTPGR